jgi:peroxiredoxin
MLAEGATMPKIDVLDERGEKINTGDLLGKTLVLWFYPKDATPG